MGLRFSKRVTLFPGVRVNLGLKGASLSVGPRGANINIGKRGIYGNVGIPGSGLSYRERLDKPRPKANKNGRDAATAPEPEMLNFTVKFVDGTISYNDADGAPCSDVTIATIKRVARDQLISALESRVDQLNAIYAQLELVLLNMPAPCMSMSVPKKAGSTYRIQKPVRPLDATLLPDYMEKLSAWRVAAMEFEVTEAADSTDLEAVAAPVIARLTAVEWPRETHVELDLDETGTTLILKIDLPEIEDLPSTRYAVDRRDLGIVQKALSKGSIAMLYAQHVHAIVLRAVGESFAAHGCIEIVKIGAYSQRLSNATGRIEDAWLLGMTVDRSSWRAIEFGNLAAVDPVEAAARFSIQRKMKANGEMGAINWDMP